MPERRGIYFKKKKDIFEELSRFILNRRLPEFFSNHSNDLESHRFIFDVYTRARERVAADKSSATTNMIASQL